VKIVVYHGYYGCDTDCCGHVIKRDDNALQSRFTFSHPYGGDHREFARNLVREQFGDQHVADLDWDNCHIFED